MRIVLRVRVVLLLPAPIAIFVLDDFIEKFRARRGALESMLVRHKIRYSMQLELKEAGSPCCGKSQRANERTPDMHSLRGKTFNIFLESVKELMHAQCSGIHPVSQSGGKCSARSLLPTLE